MSGRACAAAPASCCMQQPPLQTMHVFVLLVPCLVLALNYTPALLPPGCSAELASKLQLLEGKLLHGEQAGRLDRLAQQAAAQLSRQQVEMRQHKAAEEQARQRIAALESSSQAVQQHTQALQDQAAEVTARLQAATAEYEAARAEVGDVYGQWERDREELVAQIRRASFFFGGGEGGVAWQRVAAACGTGCLLACQGSSPQAPALQGPALQPGAQDACHRRVHPPGGSGKGREGGVKRLAGTARMAPAFNLAEGSRDQRGRPLHHAARSAPHTLCRS